MCGICGVIQITGEARQVVPDHVLDRMNDAMAHRGPNDHGTHVSPRRLDRRPPPQHHRRRGRPSAVLERGRHDLGSPRTGELFNHVSLRDDLRRRGHAFASRCDTEILPHLYEEYGPTFPTQLRGMFGVAIWDQVRRRGVIARDRLGSSPSTTPSAATCSSSHPRLKSLLASRLVPATSTTRQSTRFSRSASSRRRQPRWRL